MNEIKRSFGLTNFWKRTPVVPLIAVWLAGLAIFNLTIWLGPTPTTTLPPETPRATSKVDAHAWPLFRGNPLNNGVANSSLPSQLEVLWEYTVPNGAFSSSAVLVEVDGRRMAVIGDLDQDLHAIDLQTGEKIWTFPGDLGFVATPAFDGSHFFIGDVAGKFYCLDAKGQKRWEFTSDAQIDSSANFYQDNVIFGSQDSHLYCLKKETGELVWKTATGDQIRCSPTIVEGRVFAAGCDGILHIFDLNNGQETGGVPIESPTGSTPAAGGDLIFFGTAQAGFKAVNWRKPELAWTALADEGGTSDRGNALVYKNHVVFGTASRQLISLHPETGAVNWQTTLRSGIESSPVLVDEKRIFVGDGSGRLYEVELETGKVIKEQSFRGKLPAGPAVGFGRLVIASERGVVYCLGEPTKGGTPNNTRE